MKPLYHSPSPGGRELEGGGIHLSKGTLILILALQRRGAPYLTYSVDKTLHMVLPGIFTFVWFNRHRIMLDSSAFSPFRLTMACLRQ